MEYEYFIGRIYVAAARQISGGRHLKYSHIVAGTVFRRYPMCFLAVRKLTGSIAYKSATGDPHFSC